VIFRNARILARGLEQFGDVAVEDGRITAMEPPGVLCGAGVDVQGLYLSHGFIDIHVHGGGGFDFMDGTVEAWHGASALHLRHGTTAMVPTTLAAGREELLAAFAAGRACGGGFPDGARLLGVHIEGPYLAPEQCGAQDPAHIREPDPAEVEELYQACPRLLRWTIAPERPGAYALGDWLSARGVVPCIGHSSADEGQVRWAILHGYRHVTHLYSATSTIVRRGGFRHAGIVESAYLLDGLSSEVIADGCHLPASLLELAYRQIGPRRLCLVTDAMRAAGQTEGESVLGSLERGQRVILEDGVAKLPDRSAFAGSICTADRLVANMVGLAGASMARAVEMITETPARILGLDAETGLLAPGRRADLVLFDDRVNIQMVMVDGAVRWSAGGYQ